MVCWRPSPRASSRGTGRPRKPLRPLIDHAPRERWNRRAVLGRDRNDWRSAAAELDEECVLEWPQSDERIRGRENFIAVNAHYPAARRWRFTVQRIVADEVGAASHVGVTDGAIVARAVTFFEIRDGRIHAMTEFWPDPFPAAEWRARWVERQLSGNE